MACADQTDEGAGLGQVLSGFPLAMMLISTIALAALVALRTAVVTVFQIDLVTHMKILGVAVLRYLFRVAENTVVGL